jgi:serpin B
MQDLAPLIKDNGSEIAFSKDADFNQISKDKVFVSQVVQKTIIEVEENKNKNFTELIVSPNQIERDQDNTFIRFKADHPFIFIVRDNLNRSILLIGKVIFPNFTNLSAEFYN